MATTKKKSTRKKRAKNSQTISPASKLNKRWKFEDWMLPTAKILSEQGLSVPQIAQKLGIHPSTLYRYMATDDVFCNAIKMGKDLAVQMVEDSLMTLCLGTSDAPPSFPAVKFFLTNRDPDRWRERAELAVSETKQVTITVEDARKALLADTNGQEVIDVEVDTLDGPTNSITGTDPT
jgi:AcrR family transcriptional regulator